MTQPENRESKHTYNTHYDIGVDAPEAQALLRELRAIGEEIEHGDTDDAPFAHYAKNNDEVWRYVPHEKVVEFLDKKPFIDTTKLHEDQDGTSVIIKGQVGQGQINFPLSLIISAAGFDSWRGRAETIEKSYNSKFGAFRNRPSLEAIKHYASLETELPPVGELRIYIQPDGTAFADNKSGDSHRIAAAYLRGDKMIRVDELRVVRLRNNLIQRDAP